MSFLNILGDVAKVAAPIVGTVVGGPFGAVVGAGISKAIGGIQQGAQASALEKQNVRPVDTPESQYYQNEAEADQNAQQGMGAQQYTNSQNDIQRNQNFGLRAATQRGGGLASIGGLVSNGNDATNSLNQQDEQDRMKNQQTAYTVRNALAQRRQQAFNWNDKQKFLENSAAIRALKASSAQNIWGGLNTAVGAGTGSASGIGAAGGVTSGLAGASMGRNINSVLGTNIGGVNPGSVDSSIPSVSGSFSPDLFGSGS